MRLYVGSVSAERAAGYSVMAWLRVESFNEPTQRPGTYQPALYYLMNDQEAGIEAHLSKVRRDHTCRLIRTAYTHVHSHTPARTLAHDTDAVTSTRVVSSSCLCPHFYSLGTTQAGMLIGASNGKGRKQNVRVPFNFEERRWYHVCVAHEYRYIRSSEVSLYVDGHLIGTAALAFPKVRLCAALSQVKCSASLVVCLNVCALECVFACVRES